MMKNSKQYPSSGAICSATWLMREGRGLLSHSQMMSFFTGSWIKWRILWGEDWSLDEINTLIKNSCILLPVSLRIPRWTLFMIRGILWSYSWAESDIFCWKAFGVWRRKAHQMVAKKAKHVPYIWDLTVVLMIVPATRHFSQGHITGDPWSTCWWSYCSFFQLPGWIEISKANRRRKSWIQRDISSENHFGEELFDRVSLIQG